MARQVWVGIRRIAQAIIDLIVDYSFYLRPSRWRQQAFIRHTLAHSVPRSERRMIIALSTMPDRISRLQPILRSLLRQTRLPDEIVLAVPRFSIRQQRSYVIPDYLADIPRLRLIRCEQDWGPATKFIAAVREELANERDDTLIMVVDDDRIYPRNSVELYLRYHAQFPQAALCFRGGPIPRTLDWRDCRIEFGTSLREPKPTAVITGCGSYLIQPRFFDSSLWDYSSAPESAFYMDDIWISGCLERRGIEKYIIPASSMMRTALSQVGTMTLHDVPKGRQHHNNETISFFSQSWKLYTAR